MKSIRFPFITLIFIGILIGIFVLSLTIISSQRDSIAEEEMRLESTQHDIFGKYFDPEYIFTISQDNLNIVEYSQKVFNSFIGDFLYSGKFEDAQTYKDHVQATSENLESKRGNFVLHALGAKKRSNPVSTLISAATSIFIHLNLLHIVLIAGLLWIVGINAEWIQGFWYFMLLTVGGVLFSFLGTYITPEGVATFGFMPGIAVCLGSFLVHNYDEESWIVIPGVIKGYGVFLIIPWIIVEVLLFLFVQNETYKSFSFMHIGALAFGAVLGVVTKIGRRPLESAVEKEDMDPLGIAKRDIRMKNYRGAIEKLGNILRKNPGNGDAARLMMQAYLASRSQQECLGMATYFIKDLMKRKMNKVAFDIYMDFSDAHPSAALPLESQFLAGKLLAENNFYEMAVDAYTKVTQLNPSSEESIQSVFAIGKLQLEQLNQPQNAAGMFNWIVQHFPNHALAPQARQLLQRAQGMG